MKSQQLTFVIGAWDAMFKDIASVYPDMVRDISRDRKTLHHQIEHRGFGFLTLDLPLLDDLLLAGLEHGSLPNEFLLFGKAHGARVPRLFQGLWLNVFDNSGCLLEEADATSILFLRQLALMWKKLEKPCSDNRLRKAVNEYVRIEGELLPPTLNWGSEEFLISGEIDCSTLNFADYTGGSCNSDDVLDVKSEFVSYHSHHHESTERSLKALDRESRRFCDRLPYFDPHSTSNRFEDGYEFEKREAPTISGRSAFRHGPGAVADGQSGTMDKFRFPTWSNRLTEVFPFFPFGATSSHRITDIPSDLDVSSRLIAVPKTQKSPRLIAAEPTANQWCQQHIAAYFYHGTDFFRSICNTKDQKVSRAMVVQSSRDRSLATIDLSSASDRLSCRVVERIFASRPDILLALNAVRTSRVSNNIRKTAHFELHSKKYASQGTACTFPIQSIVFALIAIAACGLTIESARGKVRVFGDDIIVPRQHVHKVMSLLHSLGLLVNENKSFHKGYFRESCGRDAFRGVDVTPVKFVQLPNASKPTTIQSLFDYQNNLHKKGMWQLADFVRIHCKFAKNRRISNGRLDDSALYSFSSAKTDHLRSRWNEDTQTREVRVAVLLNTAKPVEREPLSRLMYNQHSNFGDSFSASEVKDRPRLVKAWSWEADSSAYVGQSGLVE